MRHNPVDLLYNAEDKLAIVEHCILFSNMEEINPNAFAVLPESITKDVIQANEVVLKMVDYFFFKKNVEATARQLSRQRTIS